MRCLATGIPDEWPPRGRKPAIQNPAYRPAGFFSSRAVRCAHALRRCALSPGVQSHLPGRWPLMLTSRSARHDSQDTCRRRSTRQDARCPVGLAVAALLFPRLTDRTPCPEDPSSCNDSSPVLPLGGRALLSAGHPRRFSTPRLHGSPDLNAIHCIVRKRSCAALMAV
jgi:hypothetical protein